MPTQQDQRAKPAETVDTGSRPATNEKGVPHTPIWRGMSSKLLVLTILFVMIGEVLIYVPSIANFRNTWLHDKISSAELLVLALETSRDLPISGDLRYRLLDKAGVRTIALKEGDMRRLILTDDTSFQIQEIADLRQITWSDSIINAFDTLFAGGNRVILAVNTSMANPERQVEIVIDDAPLYAAMMRYSINILTLSIILSLIVATLIFSALHWTLVRPMRRLTINMLRFSRNPEDASRIIRPSNRSDEIGIAERELSGMQNELAVTLQQKNRLAALGLAVSKISHDLRNILASAQLMSDRLSAINDPTVQRFAPKLIASLDRAIGLCVHTLKYGRAQEAPPHRERFKLHPLVDELIENAAQQTSVRVVFYNDVPSDLVIDADRDHIFRILMNLLRNGAQALEPALDAGTMIEDGAVRVKAWRDASVTNVEVIDNGSGVPDKVREHLFEAFQSGAKEGGTGLGLAISAELVRAHGGSIHLADTETGSAFRFTIPDQVAELRPGRRGQRRTGT